MSTASWVICEIATKKAIFETYDEKSAAMRLLNTAKYEAVPIHKYLTDLNKAIKSEEKL